MLDRDALWKRLIDVGLRGKMWRVLRNLYEIVESCVLVGHQRTEWFQVEAGVRQGCILPHLVRDFHRWVGESCQASPGDLSHGEHQAQHSPLRR